MSGHHLAAQRPARATAGPVQQTLRFYNAPVGYPGYNGTVGFWDTRLQPVAATAVGPARVPYQLQFATVSVTRTITQTLPVASIFSQAYVRLGLSLAAIDGAAPAAVPGRVAGDTITYPAVAQAGVPPRAAPVDLALRATGSGLDARIVLHGPPATGVVRVSLDLAAPYPLALQQQAGPILIEQLIPLLRRDGTLYGTSREVAYVLGAPVVRDSSRDAGAAAFTGPARMGATPAASGTTGAARTTIALAVDPAWLRDPHRAYPVTLDLPILTGLAAGGTGFYGTATGSFGTVSSCAPAVRAPLARVIVGMQGRCRYRGQLYVDVSPIHPDAALRSAILNVFTPRQVGPTGVSIYPNAAPGASATHPPASWLPPSWDTAPAPVAHAGGIPQSGSEGHWQRWDLTAPVRRWVQRGYASNGGATLIGTGAPMLFAWPLGTGDDDPSTAPYLEVSYIP